MEVINMHDEKKPHLKKHEWEALGRLLLPVRRGGQSTLEAKTAIKLVALGLIERYYEALPPNPSDPPWVQSRMRMTITGYRMTPLGEVLYGEWENTQATEVAGTPDTSDSEREPSGRVGS